MKGGFPYTLINARVAIIAILMTTSLASACKNQKQDHSDHAVSSANQSKADKDDSMPGMDMSAHSRMPANMPDTFPNEEHPDSVQDESIWSTMATNRTVIAKQEVIKPFFGDTSFSIRAYGFVTFDARRNQKIAVRVGGRIERLYVKYNYQYVHKGEKIAELYSPDLNTDVEEYLYVKRTANDSLLQAKAREKLILLGLTAAQVNQIEELGKVPFTIALYSPFEGYALFNPSALSAAMDNKNIGAGMTGGMNDSRGSQGSAGTSALSDNTIREGVYVSRDQTLFWINDFKEVWGILAFKDNEEYIRKGQAVVLESELLPDQPFRSAIQFIEPVYQEGQKFTRARIYLPNNHGILKQNSLVSANVFVSAKSLMLPASAVYYLGRVSIVWIREGTTKQGSYVFQARVVKTGRRTGEKIEILQGLEQNESVAKDAAYLVDRESIINY